MPSAKSLRKTNKTIYCGKWKPLSDFYTTKNNKYRGQCKECLAKQSKLYYEIEENREKRNLRSKQYTENHKEERRTYNKTYTANHKEEKREYDKIYNEKNKDKLKIQKKEYNIKNKDKLKIIKKKYAEENREELNEYKNVYKKERRQRDPIFRLQEIVSSQIRNKLKSTKNNKSIQDYLPSYDIWLEKMWERLQALFLLPSNLTKDGKVWMTRDNWGLYNYNTWDDNDPSTWTWQIDHIIPHSTFQYISMDCEEFRKCWSHDNLRPLSAKINISENKFRTTDQIFQIKNEISEFLQ